MGKAKNSTPFKIKTPEQIGMKFGTIDYVLEISTPEQIWWRSEQRWFLGKYVKYTMLVTFFIFFSNRPGGGDMVCHRQSTVNQDAKVAHSRRHL